MQVLDLPHELLSYIVHFADPDTLRALCLTEKRILYNIACDFLWGNAAVVFGTDQNPKPNLFSFDSERLAAIRSLCVVVDGYFDVCLSSFTSVLASMNNINRVRLSLEELEVHGPDTCGDAGCRDVLHLAGTLECPFSSLEELVLDIPLSQDMHPKLLQLIPAFPLLNNSPIVSRANETSIELARRIYEIHSPRYSQLGLTDKPLCGMQIWIWLFETPFYESSSLSSTDLVSDSVLAEHSVYRGLETETIKQSAAQVLLFLSSCSMRIHHRGTTIDGGKAGEGWARFRGIYGQRAMKLPAVDAKGAYTTENVADVAGTSKVLREVARMRLLALSRD
ncbi:hypothetical protein ARMSODRAFT_1006828 [Armillaria solidipes]|uniref:F-box domain-containing protein n=1 Tax=Armillaria solidipes TaxID=1076256 RepID=A0A2H3B7W4_9AGAR|nr:hypothetical protein ARMSODRAFT_1006828 [Armillaria solidipes]